MSNIYWDPIVPLQTGPVEMHYTWNGTGTTERGEKVGVLVQHIPPLIHLLMPDSAASPAQHAWYTQPGQVPQTANLPLLKARGACSAFHWYVYLATVFVPFIGLEDVIANLEFLPNSPNKP